MRIGFLTNDIANGGASESLFILIKALKKDFSSLELFLLAPKCSSEVALDNYRKYCKVTIISQVNTFTVCPGSPPSYVLLFWALLRSRRSIGHVNDFIAGNKLDILHVNSTVFAYLYFGIKRSNFSLITHVRENIFAYGSNIIARYLLKCIQTSSDRIISISSEEVKFYSRKASVIYNPSRYLQKHTEKNFALSPLKILMMGRWTPHKGVSILLEAIIILVKKNLNRDIEVTLLGRGRRRSLAYRLLRMGLTRQFDIDWSADRIIRKISALQNCRFSLRVVDHSEDVGKFLSEAHVLVRASLFSDPWGRDIIEGMSYALPIVATGRVSPFVLEGVNGWLCSPDPLSLAESLAKLISDTDQMVHFSRASRKLAEEYFDPARHAQLVFGLYRECGSICGGPIR